MRLKAAAIPAAPMIKMLLLAVLQSSANADISQLLTDAAKLHLGSTRPRISEEVIQSLSPPSAARLSGEFALHKEELIDDRRERILPKTNAEQPAPDAATT